VQSRGRDRPFSDLVALHRRLVLVGTGQTQSFSNDPVAQL